MNKENRFGKIFIEYRIPPGYRRRLVWKGVGLFLCAGAILLLLGFLLRSGILAF